MKNLLIWVLLSMVAAAGCSETPPTPVGTSVIDVDLSKHLPERLQSRSKVASQLKTHTQTLTIAIDDEQPAAVSVTWHTLEDAFITDVNVAVKANDVCVVTSTGLGHPLNLGTHAVPVMAVPFLLSCTHVSGRKLRTASFTLRADGRVAKAP